MRLTTAESFTSHAGTSPGSLLHALRTAFRGVRANWLSRARYRQDAEQLEQFSDRELWDLGLGRSDLPAIARGLYRRE